MQSLVDVQPARPSDRAWIAERVRRLQADARRSADTHLVRVLLPDGWDVDLYLKDESTHRTGSLKHRLARSLFLHALCNGWIGPGTTAVEASSGSTAVSEAWFARMLDIPFVAVMARTTSPEKIALIEREGGRCHLVDDPASIYAEAARLTAEVDGHFLDQFTYAERATDWRGNNNIAESIYEQLQDERHPVPEWVVVGAGTGGTSATLGRFARYRQLAHQGVRRRPGELGLPDGPSPANPPTPPAGRGSRASAGPGSSRASSPRWSSGCSASPTPRRSPRCGSCATAPACGRVGPPAPTSTARCSSRAR